jgi:hypothetical protein
MPAVIAAYNRGMPQPRLPLRLVFLAALAIGAVLALGFVVATLNNLLEFYQRIAALPLWLRAPLVVAGALLLAGIAWALWKLARPARTRSLASAPAPVSRDEVDTRVAALRERHVDTAALEAELTELDRRRDSGEFYVALFGEISTGKSSAIRALAPQAAPDVDVRGGTTRHVEHHRGPLRGGRELILADVPGSGEVDGLAREQLARDEALRAHAVVYLTDADLTRAGRGNPLARRVRQADRARAQQSRLVRRCRTRGVARAVPRAVREDAARDRRDQGGRQRTPRTRTRRRSPRACRTRTPARRRRAHRSTHAHQRGGHGALEAGREAAVLAEVGRRGDTLARETAARESAESIAKYTRRAVVGALAAVAPGTDLLIQGALATGLVRELAHIHGVAVREIDVEALLSRVGLTVRNTSALVLAIAGNALKAFPGLGTLGGGVLHAIAYGLVFDSLGRALADTLAAHAALDAADIETRLRALLAEPARERVERVARIAFDAVRRADVRDASAD